MFGFDVLISTAKGYSKNSLLRVFEAQRINLFKKYCTISIAKILYSETVQKCCILKLSIPGREPVQNLRVNGN